MNYNCTEELLRLINKSNEIAVENEMLKKENQSLKDRIEFLDSNEQKLLNDNLDLIEENQKLESELEELDEMYEERCYVTESYRNSLVELSNKSRKEIEDLKKKLEIVTNAYKAMLNKVYGYDKKRK